MILSTNRTIHQTWIWLFTEIFDHLSSNEKNKVYKQVLVDELMGTR